MRGQGIRLPDGDWLRLDDENLSLIADRLLSLPGIAIVELPEPDSTRYEGRRPRRGRPSVVARWRSRGSGVRTKVKCGPQC
jgi:hypothetical protein